jgi:hypothetical protein
MQILGRQPALALWGSCDCPKDETICVPYIHKSQHVEPSPLPGLVLNCQVQLSECDCPHFSLRKVSDKAIEPVSAANLVFSETSHIIRSAIS